MTKALSQNRWELCPAECFVNVKSGVWGPNFWVENVDVWVGDPFVNTGLAAEF